MGEKNLILFTNYYPFYKGEEYIENEIDIASEKFNNILIIPTMVDRKMAQTRKVPGNVKILHLKTDCSAIGKIKMLLGNFAKTFRTLSFKDMIHNANGLYLHKMLYEMYFFCRVEAVYDSIVKDPEFKSFIKKEGSFVLYSYWMHVVASITSRIRERVFKNKVRCYTRGHRYDMYNYAAPCGFVPDRTYTFDRMDGIFPCSQDGADYLKKLYPKYKDKISVQRLGTVEQVSVKCNREPYFTLVSCSGVRKVKRLDKIIETVKLLIKNGEAVRWVHLGDGPDLDKIKNSASANLPSEAYCFAGRLKNFEVYDWYKNNLISCFINLSDSEGVPVSIMEAMSFGIPVIATDVGGTREIIENGDNGYIVSADDDIDLIAEKVKNLISMKQEEYEKVCMNSKKIWTERSSAVSLYNDFYDIITR